MRIVFILVVAVFSLVGCAAAPTWEAVSSYDEFSGKTTVMVTTGDWPRPNSRSFSYGRIYPVVMETEEGLAVGFMSGGRLGVPIGAVQMRVDDNEAILVTPENTPKIGGLETWFPPLQVDIPGVDSDALAAVQKSAVDNAMRMHQPYTLVVGDEADRILSEMLAGESLIYRQMLLNQPNPSTGRVVLDASLHDAMKKAGFMP